MPLFSKRLSVHLVAIGCVINKTPSHAAHLLLWKWNQGFFFFLWDGVGGSNFIKHPTDKKKVKRADRKRERRRRGKASQCSQTRDIDKVWGISRPTVITVWHTVWHYTEFLLLLLWFSLGSTPVILPFSFLFWSKSIPVSTTGVDEFWHYVTEKWKAGVVNASWSEI